METAKIFLQNLNIKSDFSENNTILNIRAAISSWRNASVNISGYINIEAAGKGVSGIYAFNNSINNISEDAIIKINLDSNNGYGIFSNLNSQTNIKGNIYIISNSGIIANSGNGGSKTLISSTAKIHVNASGDTLSNGANGGYGNNIISIASGAKIAIEKNGATKWYEVKEDYKDENTSTTKDNTITADNIETEMKLAQTSAWKTAKEIIEEENEDYILIQTDEIVSYQKQFNSALSQYDMLIKDSAYKGINLLQEDNLKVNFNEDKSANLLVKGVDVTSESIGLLAADWKSSKAVQTSLDQVLNAQDKLRSASTQLGNYYSIITTRDEFTENLINVLEEGADKLTLADMNEESANMLSLQTRQQLAINSLSLASQASQAVLRLF